MGSEKTPEMENILNSLTKMMFGRDRHDSMDAKVCVCCGSKVVFTVDPHLQLVDGALPFHDALSLKEYSISGLCDVCQSSVFDCDQDDEE